jgi:hypothetical protein
MLFWGGMGGGGGELNMSILRIQKRMIRSMVGVSSRTSCRQLFKELNILTLICFIRKYHQSVELNSNVHIYNTQRKMDIHIQSYNTEIYKKKCNKHGD